MKYSFLATALLGLLCAATASHADNEKVALKPVKYDELTKLIAAQKGKVVVIDFWSDT